MPPAAAEHRARGDARREGRLRALSPTATSAQQAVNRLRAAGVADREITIQSAQPMEDFEFGHIGTRPRGCGGSPAAAASSAWRRRCGLTWLTETSWPINVGGLPIFAWWPNLIIMFELTMLGAILATVVTLVVTARLGRGSAALRSGGDRRQDPRRRRESFRDGCG